MNVVAVVTFEPSGEGSCLYTELIDLQEIGALQVRRASEIEFNNERQLWEVKNLSGRALFFSRTRSACLAWEQSGGLGAAPEEAAP